jgi:2-(1,2-epoxy-1,2-dihydrophenyl)acetyl-CoA isomerase
MSEDHTILYSQSEGVGIIRLNRPARRNALTTAMLDELLATVQQAGADKSVRALLLTGAGAGFCAGQDLGEIRQLANAAQVAELLRRHYRPLVLALCALPKPVIAAVNGIAAGAGASLALACDMRVMAEDAGLLMAFSNIGLVPDAGATWLLSRLVGYSRAFEIAAGGERIDAARCLALGLANRLAPVAALEAEALAWAQALAQRPTYALGLTKQLLHAGQLSDLSTALEAEASAQADAAASADYREGVAAFLEKRPPHFIGA